MGNCVYVRARGKEKLKKFTGRVPDMLDSGAIDPVCLRLGKVGVSMEHNLRRKQLRAIANRKKRAQYEWE